MSIEGHIESLKTKHTELENKLKEALKAPATRDAEIASLKKEKLRIKDEIEALLVT